MPNTYVALRTETVTGSPVSSVNLSLSGISGYTDLRLVIGGTTTVTGYAFTLGVNGDTGSNYSQTLLSGNGTSAQSARYSNATNTSMYLGGWVSGYDSAAPSTILVDLMNYSNTTTNKTILWRSNSATRNTEAGVILWRNTVAITSITIYAQSGSNIAVGTTFSLYGIANADQGAAKATGGIITEDATYWYHTFGASGAFIPKQALTCDVLVVAGGGGSGAGYTGNNRGPGGGGAGGFRTATGQSLTATTYNVTVGGGGNGAPGGTSTAAGTKGSNSVFNTITSTGGGGGGWGEGAGTTGGSGGGSGDTGGAGAAGNQGGYSPVEGFAGGAGANSTGGGGGGGGSASVGSAGTGATPNGIGGAGGAGTSNSYSGFAVTYAAGGRGGDSGPAAAGSNGTSYTGNGGNAPKSGTGTGLVGGNGGSGIVIVRYAK